MKIKILCLILAALLILSGCGTQQTEAPTEAPAETTMAATENVTP